jgi:four helix bundle protein
MQIRSAKDLDVYKDAYALAMEVFDITRNWPPEERFALTGQIRRASRSVCANLREAWAKRRYEAHFISKLTDADGENSETDTWLDFARDSGYLSTEAHKRLTAKCNSVGRMLGAMLRKPTPFLVPSTRLASADRRPLTSDLRPSSP